jgi:Lon protease-like protein
MTQRELPLFPLNVVLFPGMRLPLHIFEERYKLMIGICMVTDQTFGVALIESGPEVGGPAEVYPIGTTARIVEIDRLPEGRLNLVAVGVDRFRIVERLEGQPYAMGRVELLADVVGDVPDGLARRVAHQFRRYLISRGVKAEQVEALRLPDDPLALSYLVAGTLQLPVRRRQRLLEADSALSRLRRELAILEWITAGPDQPNARSFSLN